MEIMGIHELEEQLFEDWKNHLKQRMDSKMVDNLMCPDGLHYTGTKDKSNKYWVMERDYKEEDLWKKAKIRPLFLTKDHNLRDDKIGVDVREETGFDNDTNKVYYRFYAKFLMLLYGLTQINFEDGSYPPLEEATDWETYINNFYKVPVVRMNLKKIAGNNKCTDDTLRNYINEDKEFIHKQIFIYLPNIIVCCHGAVYQPRWNKPDEGLNPMMSMLKEFYKDMESVKFKEFESYNLYYSEKNKVVIIHEWHPSDWTRSYEEYYSPIKELARFLHENPSAIR